MLELITLLAFVGYLVYLRYYADQRTPAQQEADRLREGIDLYANGQLAKALAYFNAAIAGQPKASVAYLYRARIYHDLGDPDAALHDLNRGKSHDDTVADLHVETGRIYYERGDYERAFLDFDKAVFHAHGDEAEPYRWRGLTRQQLHQDEASRQDLARAVALTQLPPDVVPARLVAKPRFFDRKLLLHMGLVCLSSLLLLLVIRASPTIHGPYLAAAILAVLIGFLEPSKGWVLAVQQAVLLWLGYTLVLGLDVSSVRRDVEAFGLYGSIGLTFVGSVLGGLLQRSLR